MFDKGMTLQDEVSLRMLMKIILSRKDAKKDQGVKNNLCAFPLFH